MREFFKLKIWKINFVVIAAIILVSSAIVFYELKKEIKIVQAGAGHNVLGFAWSENIGWISFNSSNCDTDSNGFIDTDAIVLGCGGDNSTDIAFDYGVNVDLDPVSPTFEELSGYAWSSNIGWISFDKAIACNPPGAPYNAAETFMAKLNTATDEFSGWARALSACQDNLWDGTKCTGAGAGDKSGGWDGWIKLKRNPADAGSDYGVSLNGVGFEGWAWGDSVAGWISFNSKNCDADDDGFSDGIGNCPIAGTPMASYKVSFNNNAPVITDGGWSQADVCLLGANPQAQFIWGYTDLDGDLQKKYQVEIYEDDTCTLSVVGGDSGEITSSLNFFTVPAGVLEYGKEYWYKVRVWDTNDAESNIIGCDLIDCNFNGLAGILHQYPTANFSYSPPLPILQFQEITFDPLTPPDDSSAYGTGIPVVSFEWDFDDDGVVDETTFPASPNATHSYLEAGLFTVDLRVTDSDGYACWASQNVPANTEDITIGKNSPKWNEISP